MRVHGGEQRAGAAEVHIPITQRFSYRFPHGLKAGEMDHCFDRIFTCICVSKQLIEQNGIAHIPSHQLHGAAGQLSHSIKGHG